MPAVRQLYVSSRKFRGFKALALMASSWMTNLKEIFTNFNEPSMSINFLCCAGALGIAVSLLGQRLPTSLPLLFKYEDVKIDVKTG